MSFSSLVSCVSGVYRAKLMMQGVDNETFLNTSVEENAKKYLREKFQDAAVRRMWRLIIPSFSIKLLK